MTILKAWFVEEIDLGGSIGHRETIMKFDDATGEWVRPDDKLTEPELKEWDRMIHKLGKDKKLLHPVALLDHCHNHTSHRKKK